MAITANDIHNQSFSIDRKGYDVDEVDEFLEYVANEIDILNQTIEELEDVKPEPEVEQDYSGFDTVAMDVVDADEDQAEDQPVDSAVLAAKDARIAELERQLKEKKANDNAIAQALIIAQRSADDTIANANAEADDIIADAHEKADAIIRKANDEKAEIEKEIAKLDEDCEAIRERFQDILKDFISDASNKLADISDASLMASAHARSNKIAARSYETPVMAPREEAPATADYNTPVFTRTAEVAPATPMAFVGEKDLSGFGDAVDSGFDFDELD